jgi:hypothetical protein
MKKLTVACRNFARKKRRLTTQAGASRICIYATSIRRPLSTNRRKDFLKPVILEIGIFRHVPNLSKFRQTQRGLSNRALHLLLRLCRAWLLKYASELKLYEQKLCRTMRHTIQLTFPLSFTAF